MDEQSGMSESQLEKFNQIANSLNLDSNTKDQARLFYLEFSKKRLNPPAKEDFQIYIKLAIFFASRSMEMVTVKGERIRGVGINPMQIIDNGQINIERFRNKAHENLQYLSLPEVVVDDITRLLDQMYSVYNFYKKYEALMAEIKLSHKKLEEEDSLDFLNNLKNIGWLLFVSTKKLVVKSSNETFEAIFLIAAVASYLLSNLDENFSIFVKTQSSSAQSREDVLEFILNYLKVKDRSHLSATQESFKSCLKNKLGLELTRGDFNHFDKLMNLQKRIDLYYQKVYNIDDIDERLFMINRKKNFSPKNHSPIRKKVANFEKKLDYDFEFQKTNVQVPSRRVLDYDKTVNFTKNSNFNDLKLSKMIQSPYTLKNMKITTPMTAAMEMYNWLSDKLGKRDMAENPNKMSPILEKYFSVVDVRKQHEFFTSTIKELSENVSLLEKKTSEDARQVKLKEDRKKEITMLYMNVLKEILQYHENITKNSNFSDILSKKKFHRSLYICCAQTYYFIMNIPTRSFEEFIQECHADILQTYKIVNIFMAFDQSMPMPLKKHFLDIEIDIVSRIAWKDDTTILLYASNVENGKENKQLNRGGIDIVLPEQQFFNRVLLYTATQMYHLCSGLPMNDELMEYIWVVLKYILTQRVDLIKNRHLDQMIFCTIYCVSKIFKVNLKFQEIINKFQEMPLANKTKVNEIVYEVLLDNGVKGDLIEFYNRVYIAKLKSFFNELPKMTFSELSQYKSAGKRKHFGEKPNKILQSPLKELVSSPFNLQNKANMDPMKSPTSRMMTLKKPNENKDSEESYRKHIINPKIPKQSQKVIDFDNMSSFESDADGKSKTKSYMEQEENDKETQAILSRKFELMKKNSKPMNRSNEERRESETWGKEY